MHLRISYLACAFLSLSPLVAQRTLIIPRSTKVPATGADSILLQPKGVDPQRALQGQFWSTKKDAGKVVSIAFRPLSGNAYGLQAFHVDAVVAFSSVNRNARAISYSLASNRGKDFQVCFAGRVKFPRIPPTYRKVSPFHFKFPLQRPYNMPGDKWIVWELHVLQSNLPASVGTKTAAGQIDAYSPVARVDPRYKVQMFGTACPRPASSGPSNMLLSGKLSVGAFFTVWKLRGEKVPLKGAFGLVFLGASKSYWAGLKLPFDLTPFGAKGCKIYAGLDYGWLPFFQDGSGGCAASALIPGDPRLIGRSVFFQGITYGVLNPLGIETSNGLESKIGPAWSAKYSVVMSYAPGIGKRTMWPHVGVPAASYTPVIQLGIR